MYAVNVAIFTLVPPLFVAIFARLLIGFSLLMVGIQMITTGVMGRRPRYNGSYFDHPEDHNTNGLLNVVNNRSIPRIQNSLN